jgi:hypothetical protein
VEEVRRARMKHSVEYITSGRPLPLPPPPRDSKKAVTFTEIEAERNAFHWGDGQGSNALGEPQLWGEEVRGSRTWTNL